MCQYRQWCHRLYPWYLLFHLLCYRWCQWCRQLRRLWLLSYPQQELYLWCYPMWKPERFVALYCLVVQ
jgi:hypothetical protein